MPNLVPYGLTHNDAHRIAKCSVHLRSLFEYRESIESDGVRKRAPYTVFAAPFNKRYATIKTEKTLALIKSFKGAYFIIHIVFDDKCDVRQLFLKPLRDTIPFATRNLLELRFAHFHTYILRLSYAQCNNA